MLLFTAIVGVFHQQCKHDLDTTSEDIILNAIDGQFVTLSRVEQTDIGDINCV
jgi:hypothetical protein